MSPDVILTIAILSVVVPSAWACFHLLGLRFPRIIESRWNVIRERIGLLSISSEERPGYEAERNYQDLQDQLISVRKSLAESIAVEKETERKLFQVKRDLDEIKRQEAGTTSDVKVQLEVKRECRKTLIGELRLQRKETILRRARLTDFEAEVQLAYSRKQVMIARGRSDRAASNARRIVSVRSGTW